MRQSGRRQRDERGRKGAARVEDIRQRIGDVLLVAVEAGIMRQRQREVQKHVVGIVAQACQDARQLTYNRIERSRHAAPCVEDGVLLRQDCARPNHHDNRARNRGKAAHVGAIGADRRNLDHIAGGGRECEAALHGQRAHGIAGRQRAPIDKCVADGADAAQRCPGIDGGQA